MEGEVKERMHKLELVVTQVKSEVKTIRSKLDDMKETIKELAIVAKQQIQLSAKMEELKDYKKKIDALFKKLDSNQDRLYRLELTVADPTSFRKSLEKGTWDVVKPAIIALLMGLIGFLAGHWRLP